MERIILTVVNTEMSKKTGYITKNVKGKERLAFYSAWGGPVTTQVTRTIAKSQVKEINKRYGKGTAYFRKTSVGNASNWFSVFFRV